MCNDDWNIGHRKWSKKMLSLGVPTLKNGIWMVNVLLQRYGVWMVSVELQRSGIPMANNTK
jgi:hypothetical protein